MPVTVVHDRPDEVALYLAPGASGRLRHVRKTGPNDRVISAVLDGYDEHVWRARRLVLRPVVDAHMVSLFWRGDTYRFMFWYVDFVSPLRRTEAGYDAVDHGIDIVVEPDMSAWRWKDAEELDWYVEHGRYTVDEAREIRAEGERVVRRLRRDREQLQRWIGWRPDPRWSLPVLGPGWDGD